MAVPRPLRRLNQESRLTSGASPQFAAKTPISIAASISRGESGYEFMSALSTDRSRRALRLVVAGIIVLAAVAVWWSLREPDESLLSGIDDPPVPLSASPYLN